MEWELCILKGTFTIFIEIYFVGVAMEGCLRLNHNTSAGSFRSHLLFGDTSWLLDGICCKCPCSDILQICWLHLLTTCRISETIISSLGCPRSPIVGPPTLKAFSPLGALVKGEWITDELHGRCTSRLSSAILTWCLIVANWMEFIRVCLLVVQCQMTMSLSWEL